LKTDRLGKRLIGETMLSDREIDKIIASPVLYSSIRKRINSKPAESTGFAWLRIPAVAAFASLLVVVGVAAFAFFGNSGTPLQAKRILPSNEVAQPITRSSEPDGLGSRSMEPAALEQPRRNSPQVQVVDRRPVTSGVRRRVPMVKTQPTMEFIPLVYTGDPNESINGGRVIRVEMSRASLFAMGVNIPIENGTELVKADLLVGQDGVPRAIRMP